MQNCHLITRWIEACINEPISPTVELEEGLRNGVALAKLAHFISPEIIPVRKIFDSDLSRYEVLHYIYDTVYINKMTNIFVNCNLICIDILRY